MYKGVKYIYILHGCIFFTWTEIVVILKYIYFVLVVFECNMFKTCNNRASVISEKYRVETIFRFKISPSSFDKTRPRGLLCTHICVYKTAASL